MSIGVRPTIQNVALETIGNERIQTRNIPEEVACEALPRTESNMKGKCESEATYMA